MDITYVQIRTDLFDGDHAVNIPDGGIAADGIHCTDAAPAAQREIAANVFGIQRTGIAQGGIPGNRAQRDGAEILDGQVAGRRVRG